MERTALVEKICTRMQEKGLVMIEISARHVHLTQDSVESLFGKGHKLAFVRDLSQKGQFLCEERVTLTGPKGTIPNVAVLGPCRKANQIELSSSEARKLGLAAPVRLSGDTANTPGLTIQVGENKVQFQDGVIVAKRHIHVPKQDAKRLNLQHEQEVSVEVFGDGRSLVFNNTVVRISDDASFAMHIDVEEANAAGISKVGYGIIHPAMSYSSFTNFVGEVCKEVLSTQTEPIKCAEQSGIAALNDTKPVNTKKLITEFILKEMIKDGSVSQLCDKARFTPLARDLYNEYKRNQIRGTI